MSGRPLCPYFKALREEMSGRPLCPYFKALREEMSGRPLCPYSKALREKMSGRPLCPYSKALREEMNGRPLYPYSKDLREKMSGRPASQETLDHERILVMAPSWVGDVVMATPAIRALRHRWPQARITALARQTGADVLEHNPHLDRIIATDRKGVGPESSGLRELIHLLRREKFDLAVILPNSFRTALWARLAGATRRIGYALQWRSLLLTGRVPPPRENGAIVPINMVDRYLAVAAKAGCTELSQREEVFASENDVAAADAVLSSLGVGVDDMLVVLIPGAAYGPAKLWGAERFAEVSDRLIERHGCKVLAHVGPGEEEVGRQVAAASSRGVRVAPPGAVDLKVLKGVIKRASLVIANDTGPRHYAVAFDIPNVVILGPTSRRYIDVNLERTELLQADVECGPCQLKVCPRNLECMELVTPGDVLAAAEALLG